MGLKPLVDAQGVITGWAVDLGSGADPSSLRNMLGATVYVGTEIIFPVSAIDLIPLAGNGLKVVERGTERVLVDAAGHTIGNIQKSVDNLVGRPIELVNVTHTIGRQNGALGEEIATQVLNEQTGLEFKSLQNASNHGCDACAIDVKNKTIWVADAKSSQNGVDAAASAAGDPLTRLEGWLKQEWANQGENAAFAKEMDRLVNREGFQVKGLTVKVGVPAPGATGLAEVKVVPWGK